VTIERVSRCPIRAVLALALLGATTSCLIQPREATYEEARRSFEPYRELMVQGVPASEFLRIRTAIVVGGPAEIHVEPDGDGSAEQVVIGHENDVHEGSIEFGGAAALSADGYFLTVAHVLVDDPLRLVIPRGKSFDWAPARIVWLDEHHDVALVHADLRPDAWFDVVADRAFDEGELVLSYSPYAGWTAGAVLSRIDLASLGPYAPLAIAHDTPLRHGHSGGPAMTRDGFLLGVQASMSLDVLLRKKSWLVRVSPAELRRRIDEDRAALR
jgi:S1-C subfamily serine protease